MDLCVRIEYRLVARRVNTLRLACPAVKEILKCCCWFTEAPKAPKGLCMRKALFGNLITTALKLRESVLFTIKKSENGKTQCMSSVLLGFDVGDVRILFEGKVGGIFKKVVSSEEQ